MKYLLTAKACLAAACALLPAASAAEDWKVSSSVNYDTGKYGTSDRTDSVYIPFTLKRYYGYADLSVTVPWLRQSSTGRVTRVGGRPARAARCGAWPTIEAPRKRTSPPSGASCRPPPTRLT